MKPHSIPGGSAFDDDDVASSCAFRPAYPNDLIDHLVGLARQRRKALDLGCGPGKIAHHLARWFDQVDAVDPSLAMLRIADDGRRPNIVWIHSDAETASLSGPYDLITAGESIHWMNHATVFPKLAGILGPNGVMVVIDGDQPHTMTWESEWQDFLSRWLKILGRDYDPGGFQNWLSSYRPWMKIVGERTFSGCHCQSIADFIECQHSRATWSRSNLGETLTEQFDDDLQRMLQPYVHDNYIRFSTLSQVEWGTPLLHSTLHETGKCHGR